MDRVFVDRESAYPNRYLMVAEDGTQTYVVLERADEPVTPGTPLNAETFNGMMEEIDAEKVSREEVSNKNLLDNWYWADPVCQRAGYYATFAGSATSIPYYTDSAFKTQGGTWSAEKQLSGGNANYGWINAGAVGGAISYYVKPENLKRGFVLEAFAIDRWSFEQWQSSKQSVQLRSGCVAIVSGAAESTNNTTKLRQIIVNPGRLAGKTVTFSAKLKNVTVNGSPILAIYYSGTSTAATCPRTDISTSNANGIVSVTETLPTDLEYMYVAIGTDGNRAGKGGFDIEIEAVKLEIGSVSTLANDAPPKKSEQLLECQRYYIRYETSSSGQWIMGASNGATLMMPLHLPVPLQGTAEPTITAQNVNIYPYVSGGSVAVTGVSLSNNSSRQSFMVYAAHESGGMASKEPGALRITAGGFVSLSCEI